VHTAWDYRPDGVTAAQMNMYYGLSVIALKGNVAASDYAEVSIADPDVIAFIAPDRHHARIRQRVHREDVRPHHDQVENAVLDGTFVHLAHRARAGRGGQARRRRRR